MSFDTKLLPNEPILLQIWNADFSFKAEAEEVEKQAKEILDSVDEPVFYIADMRAARLTLEDVIAGANQTGRGAEPIFKHPNVRQIIFISENRILELGAKGMRSPVFGGIDVKVFKTLDEALAYVRS